MKQMTFQLPMKNAMTTRLVKYSLLLPIALICACSILPSSAPVNIYQLPQPTFKQTTSQQVKNIALRINLPNTNLQINSQRIIVLPEPNLVSSYQGSRWNDVAPNILKDRIISGFISDGRIKSVNSGDSGLYADLEIDSYLQSFQTEYVSGSPQVVIRYEAKLVNPNTRKVVSSRRFEIIEIPAGVNVPQIISAFGQATDKLNNQLIEWTIKNVDQK